MNRKQIFKSLASKITAVDIFMMIISAIVGVLFSLYPENVPEELWWIKVLIISVYLLLVISFLIIILWMENRKSKFEYTHMIDEALKNKSWIDVYKLGHPILTPLWTLSKLSLRIHVARSVEKAIVNLLNTKSYENEVSELKKNLVDIYVDVFGYTNYILGNHVEAKQNLDYGIKYIEDSCKELSYEDRLIIQMKSRRHFLAIGATEERVINDLQKYINEVMKYNTKEDSIKLPLGETDKWVTDNLDGYIEKAMKYDSGNKRIKLALCSVWYAIIKHAYNNSSKKTEVIDKVKANLQKLSENFRSELQNNEWALKCDQLILEIRLESEGYISGFERKIETIINGGIVRNRFLKVANLYLDCHLKRINGKSSKNKSHDVVSNEDYEKDIKEIIDRCDQISIQSEDIDTVNKYYAKRRAILKLIK